VLLVVLGAMLTTLDQASYWTAKGTHSFLWKNASLRGSVRDLPGVFEGLKFGGAVNGSLWSLPVELRLYIIIACFGLLGAFRTRFIATAVLFIVVVTACFYPELIFFFKTVPANLRVGAFFAAGAVIYVQRCAIPLHGAIVLALFIVAAFSKGTPVFEWLAGITLVYSVFFIAFARKLCLPRWVSDYSYGIYLYAWPIQQLISLVSPRWGPYEMVAVALPLSWICGALSWHIVERPVLRLKRVDIADTLRLKLRGIASRI
jgi:peptidoglycan/LPS O-acetylase OafA/YrhL